MTKKEKEILNECVKNLEGVADACDRVTTGNLSHQICNVKAGIINECDLIRDVFKLKRHGDNDNQTSLSD